MAVKHTVVPLTKKPEDSRDEIGTLVVSFLVLTLSAIFSHIFRNSQAVMSKRNNDAKANSFVLRDKEVELLPK